MFDISVEEREEYVLVVVSGRIDQQSAPDLRQRLADLVENGNTHIVLDLEEVDYLGSTALHIMVQTWRSIQELSGQLWLTSISPDLEAILAMTGLDNLFPIRPIDDL